MRIINSLNNIDLPYDMIHIQLTYQDETDDAPMCYKVEAGFTKPIQVGEEVWVLGAYSTHEKQIDAWNKLHKAILSGDKVFVFPSNDI